VEDKNFGVYQICYLNEFKKGNIERHAISVGEMNTVKNALVGVIKGNR
jgi:hypothetical protein